MATRTAKMRVAHAFSAPAIAQRLQQAARRMVEAVAAVPRSVLVVGLQLAVFWVIMRVLDELSQREIQIAQDLEGQPCKK